MELSQNTDAMYDCICFPNDSNIQRGIIESGELLFSIFHLHRDLGPFDLNSCTSKFINQLTCKLKVTNTVSFPSGSGTPTGYKTHTAPQLVPEPSSHSKALDPALQNRLAQSWRLYSAIQRQSVSAGSFSMHPWAEHFLAKIIQPNLFPFLASRNAHKTCGTECLPFDLSCPAWPDNPL